MKKNIFTIIIMALGVINVVLTAVIVFTMVPAMNKTSNLVNEISQMVDLELEASEKDKNATVSYKDTEVHTFKSSKEETVTINLKASGDGAAHYALLDAVYVTVNKKAEDYKDLAEVLDSRGSDVLQKVTDVIGSYDYEKLSDNKDAMRNEVIKELQNFFETEAITDVSFDNLRIQ